jgi:2-polyprenyl-3-methyl-5-hydroxy-6-metoxy-1,4-benzoquinol methylase
VTCRVCGGSRFTEVVDLGEMPLVNNLASRREDVAQRWPLHVTACETCSLAQLTAAPPPSSMFDEYCYFSSQSQTMVRHAMSLVKRFVRPGHFVVEIASNDGYLLAQAQNQDACVLGVDPARNVAAHANAAGVPTMCEYFDASAASAIADAHGLADVIFANNVLAHVPDPHQIAEGVKRLLKPEGRAHIEVPWLRRLIEQTAFDTIYHEHQCYFSLEALDRLFTMNGLAIVDVEEVAVHGGSLHVQLGHAGRHSKVDRWIEAEREFGTESSFAAFRARMDAMRRDLTRVISSYETAAGYGAAAKAVVMLNTFGLTRDRLPWVADVSPHKQGKFVPGTGQSIVSPDRLLESMPEACVIFAWNLVDEIAQRNAEYLRRGGTFIVPVPRVHEIALTARSLAGACRR